MNCSNDNISKETSPGDNSSALLKSKEARDVEDLFLSEDESDVEDVYATCNESDGLENDFDDKPVLPPIISTDRIDDVNSNKATISSKFEVMNGTQQQSSHGDKSSLYVMSSPNNTRRNNAISNESGDVAVADTLSEMDIDDAQTIHDMDISKEKRKESLSPCVDLPVVKIPRLQIIGSSLDSPMSHPHSEEKIKFFDTARSIQAVEVALASTESIPPIQKTLMWDTFKSRMNKQDVVLNKFREKAKKSMKIIRDHGIVHSGESMGQVSWITLGGVKETQDVTEWKNDDLITKGVGLSLSSPVNKVRNNMVADDVYEFHETHDNDFIEEDIDGDSDFADKKETSKKGKGRGKGSRGGKVGRGRGRRKKKTDVENNPSVVNYYSPVKTKDEDEEGRVLKTRNVSPTTAMCTRVLKNLSGSSGYTHQSQSLWQGRRSSPRGKPLRGNCPICGKDFDMFHLETHASECEG